MSRTRSGPRRARLLGEEARGRVKLTKDEQRAIEEARQSAKVDCLPAEPRSDETAAFDVVVDGLDGLSAVMIGRWSQQGPDKGIVTWPDGSRAGTGGCEADPKKVVQAIIPTIPIPVEAETRSGATFKNFLRRLGRS